jgi:hypothetical protein
MDAGNGSLVAARRFDSRWGWQEGYAESPVLPRRLAEQAAFSSALSDVYRGATGADFALAGAIWESDEAAFAPRETRAMDVAAMEFSTPLALMRLSGEELLFLAEVCSKMEQDAMAAWREDQRAARRARRDDPRPPDTLRLLPAVEPDSISREREYRVVLYPWVIWGLVGQAQFVPSHFEMSAITVREAMVRGLPPSGQR